MSANSESNRAGRGYATLRDSIGRVSPPWLLERVASGILWSTGLVLDAVRELTEQGIKARMPLLRLTRPGEPHPTFALIGDDRLIDRGPLEPEDNYARRLSAAFDTWANAGGPYALLENLRAFFLPDPLPMYLVSDRSIWHVSDPPSGQVTRLRGWNNNDIGNWYWDPIANGPGPFRYWRGWIIIEAVGRWTQWYVGDGTIVGDGHTVGSTATEEEVASIRRIVKRFTPAGGHVVNIIITFVADLFVPSKTNTDAPMPNGDYHLYENRSLDAIYWTGVKAE